MSKSKYLKLNLLLTPYRIHELKAVRVAEQTSNQKPKKKAFSLVLSSDTLVKYSDSMPEMKYTTCPPDLSNGFISYDINLKQGAIHDACGRIQF